MNPDQRVARLLGGADRLAEYRGKALAALRENADLLYRHTATWSGEAQPCRFSVKDPSPASVNQTQAQAASFGIPFQDLRYVRVHPDDVRPQVGATIPWGDGELELLSWGQVSDFTTTAIGTGVFRR